jgi:CDP-diacylglycerol--glycerol-3-phosphate 3-phosphatidyltransferase
MNLPNKITLLRVVLIPAFLFVYLAAPFSRLFSAEIGTLEFGFIFIDAATVGEAIDQWLALVLFVVAAITDAIDGYLARKLGLVTNFGKLMDPLADKMLVCAAFIALTYANILPAWATIILISREFYISGLRQLALEQSIVMAASTWAKVKTGVQITLIIYLILPWPFSFLYWPPIAMAVIVVTTIISIWSAAEYTIKNREIFKKGS